MKIICIGQNYREHIAEMGAAVPDQPMFFMKPETAIIRAGLPFFYPDFSKEIHYEVELVLRICKLGKNIQRRFAHTYFKEIGIGIDFTARDLQKQCKDKGQPWEIAKSFDGSASIGSFLPLGEIKAKDNIHFSLYKNDVCVQEGFSADMVFQFDQLISHVSRYVTLKIGDFLFTGTPSGVGEVMAGDSLEAFIEGQSMLKLNIR
jgi:2-keto-4-pentenoate hydratase/2-oxohepta-3-ene-1,7-dioic acid hydratase in catechol pathway